MNTHVHLYDEAETKRARIDDCAPCVVDGAPACSYLCSHVSIRPINCNHLLLIDPSPRPHLFCRRLLLMTTLTRSRMLLLLAMPLLRPSSADPTLGLLRHALREGRRSAHKSLPILNRIAFLLPMYPSRLVFSLVLLLRTLLRPGGACATNKSGPLPFGPWPSVRLCLCAVFAAKSPLSVTLRSKCPCSRDATYQPFPWQG